MAALAAERKPEFENRSPIIVSQPADVKQEAVEGTGEEAAVATAEPNQSTEVNDAPPPSDEEGYVWPEGSAPTEAVVGVSPVAENEPEAPLPSLDELVKRIPPAAREVLDELFRARFVSVKRAEKSALKN